MNQFLKNNFGFDEHPFNPLEDPGTGFKFEGYSLKSALTIFQEEKLRRYFVETGCFKNALDQTNKYLGRRQPNQGPPVFLISGLRDSGVESVCSYVAWLIAQNAPGKKARFETIKLVNENFADWLNNIVLAVEIHVDECKVAGCKQIFERFRSAMDPASPSESLLQQLLTTLGPRVRNAPWLILAIQSISFDQQRRIDQLREILVNINAAPIFITADHKVATYFEATQLGKGICLQLRPLTAEEGIEVLKARIGTFRTQPIPGTPELFPYEIEAVKGMFADSDKVIGFFLDVCHGTLEIKSDEIAKDPSKPPTVTWEHVKRYYSDTLHKVPPKRMEGN